jgi:hypothetical protein
MSLDLADENTRVRTLNDSFKISESKPTQKQAALQLNSSIREFDRWQGNSNNTN